MNSSLSHKVKKDFSLSQLINEIFNDVMAIPKYLAILGFLGLVVNKPLFCFVLWLFINSQLSYLKQHCADEIKDDKFEGFFTARQQYKLYRILNPALFTLLIFALINFLI